MSNGSMMKRKSIDPKCMFIQHLLLDQSISQQSIARVLKVSHTRVWQMLNAENLKLDDEMRLKSAVEKILNDRR